MVARPVPGSRPRRSAVPSRCSRSARSGPVPMRRSPARVPASTARSRRVPYAVNQVQFWHDFRPEVVEKELAALKKSAELLKQVISEVDI